MLSTYHKNNEQMNSNSENEHLTQEVNNIGAEASESEIIKCNVVRRRKTHTDTNRIPSYIVKQ